MSMLHHCCGINPYNPMSCGELQHKTYEIGDVKPASDIEMPVIVNFKESGLRSQKNVVPMLPHTGVAFVVRRDRVEGDYSIQLLTSVFSAWPVLILTLLLSVLAGMIAWALDTSKNPKDFPRSFVHGACEGFWWAFVSMTTVGYGDRCPKSIQGRAFAVIWILVGICIISIFTATLTTSLTTISLDNKISLPGSKVAALVHSIDAITGFQAQADVKRFHTFEGVRAAMDNDEVVGALLDSYMIAKHKKSLPDAKYKVQEVIHQESLEYGAHVNDSGLSQCLTNFRYSKESMLYEIVEILLEKPLASGVREGSGTSDNDKLFDPDGEMFSRTLYVCFGVVGLCLLAGFTYELYRYKGGCRFRRGSTGNCRKGVLGFSQKCLGILAKDYGNPRKAYWNSRQRSMGILAKDYGISRKGVWEFLQRIMGFLAKAYGNSRKLTGEFSQSAKQLLAKEYWGISLNDNVI
ncbi:predicted protein [Nematostella vectensis]|uniref:Potassium channel domain-containing protein n=1 Tax=Nematostella vectensis TaxID=45351 RepID=A7SCL7_NEMVE|nr:predicted protein [Nematostella vectensis]|eukprot:XP_001630579.1 predicted protein [Nematostella vectensis]